jgi:hypothetical protein
MEVRLDAFDLQTVMLDTVVTRQRQPAGSTKHAGRRTPNKRCRVDEQSESTMSFEMLPCVVMSPQRWHRVRHSHSVPVPFEVDSVRLLILLRLLRHRCCTRRSRRHDACCGGLVCTAGCEEDCMGRRRRLTGEILFAHPSSTGTTHQTRGQGNAHTRTHQGTQPCTGMRKGPTIRIGEARGREWYRSYCAVRIERATVNSRRLAIFFVFFLCRSQFISCAGPRTVRSHLLAVLAW